MHKHFKNFAYREFNRWQCDGRRRVEKTLRFFVIQIGIGFKDRCSKFGLRLKGHSCFSDAEKKCNKVL